MKTNSMTFRAKLSGLALGALLLSSCSIQAPGETTTDAGGEASPDGATSSPGTAAAPDITITSPEDVPAPQNEPEMSIAFFGFARANSFASATFAGIEEYAAEHNATAEFFDPNFDAQTQVSQIQDAVTSGRFDVFVVQANDGTAVMSAVEQAVAEGITVVVEFTPVGPRYDTAEPQVPGTITLIDVPVENGVVLGEMAIEACEEVEASPCQVAYLEGFQSLPLDNARTEAVMETLAQEPDIEVVASVEGGYTADSGRSAMQDVLQANSDVDVVIGSSQAVMGAQSVSPDDVAFIGNGGSRQAIDAVQAGDWFATYCIPEKTAGATAAALGLAAARGAEVPTTNESVDLSTVQGRCTEETAQDIEGEYDE